MVTEPCIALYRGTSLISRAIQWQTDSPYSHAALWLPDGTVIEAWHRGGVRRNPDAWTEHTEGTRVDLFRVLCGAAIWDRAIRFAEKQIGCPYDFAAIARFVTRARGAHNNAWFCSELVFASFAEHGLRLLERVEAHRVSPGVLGMSPFLHRIESARGRRVTDRTDGTDRTDEMLTL